MPHNKKATGGLYIIRSVYYMHVCERVGVRIMYCPCSIGCPYYNSFAAFVNSGCPCCLLLWRDVGAPPQTPPKGLRPFGILALAGMWLGLLAALGRLCLRLQLRLGVGTMGHCPKPRQRDFAPLESRLWLPKTPHVHYTQGVWLFYKNHCIALDSQHLTSPSRSANPPSVLR